MNNYNLDNCYDDIDDDIEIVSLLRPAKVLKNETPLINSKKSLNQKKIVSVTSSCSDISSMNSDVVCDDIQMVYYSGKGSKDKMIKETTDKPFKVAYEINYGDYASMCYDAYNSYDEFKEIIKGQPDEHMRFYELYNDSCLPECYDLDAGIKDVPNEKQDKKTFLNRKIQQNMYNLYKEHGEDYVIEKFLEHRKDFLADNYPKYLKVEEEYKTRFAISTACDDSKFSVHIVVRNGLKFKHIDNLKIMMKKFQNYLQQQGEYIFDISIYSPARQMRMLGNTKNGQKRHLVKHHSCFDLDDKDFLFWSTKKRDKTYNIKIPEKKVKEIKVKATEINFIENDVTDNKEMTQLLNLINSNENPNWSTIKQCIYDKTGGSDEGLEIFTKWSRDGCNIFTDDEYYKQWVSTKIRNYETIPTLKKYAKDQNPDEYDKLYPFVSLLRKNELGLDGVEIEADNNYPKNHLDCGLFMIKKIKESGEIYYYNKKKIIYIYNDKLKIFEEQPIEKIMNFIPIFILPIVEKFNDKLQREYSKGASKCQKELLSKIKQVEKVINDIKSTPFQKNILTQIINRIEHSDDFIEKYFNRIPHLFPIANNKVIDFRTLEVMERTKDYYFTYTTDNIYLPDRPKKEDVYKYVSEILKTDKKDFITSFLTYNGYCLTGENCVKSIVFWTGDGDNGKSVCFNIFKKVAGKSGVVGNDKVFTVSPRQSDSCHTDEYLPLIGKRSTYISEVKKGCKFNERLMKHISGNDGALSLRGCGGTTLEINIDCKMIGIVNSSDMPSFETEGFDNRIKIFPFTNKFEKNPKKVVEIENMKDDIFTEFCYYVKNHFYDNDMNINFSQEIEKATNKYKISNDTVKMFFDESVEITDNGKDRIKKGDLWNKYNEFCFENEKQSIKLGMGQFYDYLETKLRLDIHKRTHYKCVKFIVIENEPDDDDE